MGTELQRAGIQDGECYELWNLTHPEKVRAIHQGYLDAGAEVFLTNTFQANPFALGKHCLSNLGSEIHTAARKTAQSVARSDSFVLMDVGPQELWTYSSSPRRLYIRQALESALETDGLLLETCSSSADAALVRLRKRVAFATNLPVLISFSYMRSANELPVTIRGEGPGVIAKRARRWGVEALGVNCGRDIGMDEIIEIIRRYREETDLPLFARPNAGTPKRIGDRWVYPVTPEMMAERLPELLEAGVSMVGGCCGTTPAHIAAMRPIVDAWNARSI